MRRKGDPNYRSINPKSLQFYIIISWAIGLFIGLHIFSHVFDEIVWKPVMQKSIPLIIRTYLFAVAPFVLIAVCRRRQNVPAIISICFLRSVLFGFAISLVSKQYHSGTWLAIVLTLFSDLFAVCLLLWFLLRQGSITDRNIRRYLYVICSILLVVCFVDAFVIAPFLQRIL